MQRVLIATATLALLLAACTGSGSGGVASLEDADQPVVEAQDAQSESDDEHAAEEAVLGFAQCMRDNGFEGFEDPDVTADGSLDFRRGQGELGDVDRETLRNAFEACQENLEGLAFGPGSFDRSEIEDSLIEFSACMRDPDRGNLPDFPDPDFSNLGPGSDGPGSGPFGEGFDFQDPAVRDALEACQDVFGGFRFGGPGGGGGRGGGDGDGTSA